MHSTHNEINQVTRDSGAKDTHSQQDGAELKQIHAMLENIREEHRKLLDAAEEITRFSNGHSSQRTTSGENQPNLSRRQTEILDLLSQGLSKHKISAELGIGTTTVATHTRHIFRKLGVSNASGAVGKAFRCGILKLDQ